MTILMLDVDGVVSPFGVIAPERRDQLEHLGAVSQLYGNEFLIDRAVTDRLAQLHHDGVVHLEWLTSWEEDARDFLGPLLGAPFERLHVHTDAATPHVFGDGRDLSATWWKERAVADRALHTSEPIIWCDDELRYRETHLVDGRGQIRKVAPHQHVGLTLTDVDSIEEWARRENARARFAGATYRPVPEMLTA